METMRLANAIQFLVITGFSPFALVSAACSASEVTSPTRLVLYFARRVILIKPFALLRREVDAPGLKPCLSMRRNAPDFLTLIR